MSAIKLPTQAEIDRALDAYGSVPPQPLAGIVDESKQLTAFLGLMFASILTEDPQTILKSVLVLGLNVGIRIGEERK